MKGHIRKRGARSWAVVLDVGRDAKGKRCQKWHSVKGSKKDAERELARLIRELDTGSYVEPSTVTLSEFLDRWLRHTRSRVAGKTYERYEGLIEGHIKNSIGTVTLARLRPLHIQGFYSDLLDHGRRDGKGGLSPRTVLHAHRVLRRALDQAVKWQLLARNPADAVEPPKPKPAEMKALDDASVGKLLNALEEHALYMPVLLAISTGMRRGELLALKWANVDFKSAQLRVTHSLEQTGGGLNFKAPKTKKSRRTIALPGLIVEKLKDHRKAQLEEQLRIGPAYRDNDLVCAREDGSPIPPDTLSTLFAAFIRRSSLPKVRFHDLRHTHATQLLKQGIHPKIVSERLGHANIAITLDTYSHVLPGMQEEAIAGYDAAIRAALSRPDQ